MASAVTPEERAEAIRSHGYREPLRPDQWIMAAPALVMTVVLLLLGAGFLFFGASSGERLRGAAGLAMGVAVCSWAWRYFQSPIAPTDDRDLQREIR